ncbi:TniQ family protein [Amycolatopsis sp. DG1A-15b]|nr:TniQ family protein [Amycolatopsis sp. DG1A-15b]WIX93546.1 TniQ family protein [Amycolatopsis sp. DG1A-15b]
MRVDPMPGESLGSWLEALSRRLSTPAVDLLPALGLDVAAERRRAAAFATYLRADEASRVAAVTGIPAPTLQEMTLAHYDAVARADPGSRRLTPHHAWARRPGTWFCPHCLAESGGRWQLRWRLGWSFACTRHRCLLTERCPGCGHVPRPGTLWLHIPQASRCSTRPGTAQRNFARCGADLTTTTVHELGAGHATLAAQHLLDTVLTTGTAAFGLYTASPAHRVFTDLAVLASRILRTTEAPRAADPDLGDLADLYRTALTDTDGSGHRPGTAPEHAVLAAVATTRALTVLGTADEAAALLAALCPPGAAGRRLVAPRHSRQRPITPQLASVLQGARRTLFPAPSPPSFARTSRAPTPSGRRRDLLGSVQRCPNRDRSATIPTVFWPWWTLRLAPQWSMGRLVRGAFACLTASSGTAMSIPATIARLDADVSRAYVAEALQRMTTEPAWDARRTALARIARRLDQHSIPIDYARRRALDYTDLLPEPRWETLLARTGFRRNASTLRSMRCLLFETISGRPASTAPKHYAPCTKNQREAYADFPVLLTARLAAELHLVAAEFLADHGIDEPVSWQPPHDLAVGLDLPGPDPDTLPRQSLTDLLRAGLPLGQASSQAGMTLDSARYLLAHHPRETRRNHDVGERLRAQLSAETFRDLYLDRRWSITALAARYQVNRRRITTLAAAYDIPLRDPSTPPPGISRRGCASSTCAAAAARKTLAPSWACTPARSSAGAAATTCRCVPPAPTCSTANSTWPGRSRLSFGPRSPAPAPGSSWPHSFTSVTTRLFAQQPPHSRSARKPLPATFVGLSGNSASSSCTAPSVRTQLQPSPTKVRHWPPVSPLSSPEHRTWRRRHFGDSETRGPPAAWTRACSAAGGRSTLCCRAESTGWQQLGQRPRRDLLAAWMSH